MHKQLAKRMRSSGIMAAASAVLLTATLSGFSLPSGHPSGRPESPLPSPRVLLLSKTSVRFSSTAAAAGIAGRSRHGTAVLAAITYKRLILEWGNGDRCLDAETTSTHNPNQNGDVVQIWHCNGNTNQEWALVPTQAGSGFYNVVTQYGNHHVLDAENDQFDNPNSNGDKIQMWGSNGQCQQKWKIHPAGNFFALVNDCSGKVIDAKSDAFGSPSDNGDYVQLWTYHGTANQLWEHV